MSAFGAAAATEARAFAQRALERSVLGWDDRTRDHGASQVARLLLDDGREVIVKRCGRRRARVGA